MTDKLESWESDGRGVLYSDRRESDGRRGAVGGWRTPSEGHTIRPGRENFEHRC